jgi:hypothetical protein
MDLRRENPAYPMQAILTVFQLRLIDDHQTLRPC